MLGTPSNLESKSETSATGHPRLSSTRILSSHASTPPPSHDGATIVTMGRESNPAGFCPPRQLQVGTSKELPLRKQDTAYWASKASAKCRNYSYRNRGAADVREAHAVPRGLGKLNFPAQACPGGPAHRRAAEHYLVETRKWKRIERSSQSYMFRTPAQSVHQVQPARSTQTHAHSAASVPHRPCH